jgi:hypothetical protein
VANTSVVNFDSDFVSLWRGNFNCLDAQILAGFPCHGRLSNLSGSLAQNIGIRILLTLQVIVCSMARIST